MALPPPRGFRFARRWWWALTLVSFGLLALFLKSGQFWIGILAAAILLFTFAAKFTEPPHDF